MPKTPDRYHVIQREGRWLVCYDWKRDYYISDHATKKEAIAAIDRYREADKRRLKDENRRATSND